MSFTYEELYYAYQNTPAYKTWNPAQIHTAVLADDRWDGTGAPGTDPPPKKRKNTFTYKELYDAYSQTYPGFTARQLHDAVVSDDRWDGTGAPTGVVTPPREPRPPGPITRPGPPGQGPSTGAIDECRFYEWEPSTGIVHNGWRQNLAHGKSECREATRECGKGETTPPNYYEPPESPPKWWDNFVKNWDETKTSWNEDVAHTYLWYNRYKQDRSGDDQDPPAEPDPDPGDGKFTWAQLWDAYSISYPNFTDDEIADAIRADKRWEKFEPVQDDPPGDNDDNESGSIQEPQPVTPPPPAEAVPLPEEEDKLKLFVKNHKIKLIVGALGMVGVLAFMRLRK